MTFIPTLDEGSGAKKLPRALDPTEVRILGALMEKQLSTPEYYPLTLNALVAASNQKSNREPVMELSESDISSALGRLQEEKLVWRVKGGRADRFDHNLDNMWHLNRREKALMTLLMLRGAQTPGELRGRSDRLHAFESIGEVEEILRDMAAASEPLVRELARRPGQKETRWTHLVGGAVADATYVEEATPAASGATSEPLSVRVQRLEQAVERLEAELRVLKEKLGE